MEQVECWVQLQHRSTSSRTRLLVGRPTVEPVLNSHIVVSPFRSCPCPSPLSRRSLTSRRLLTCSWPRLPSSFYTVVLLLAVVVLPPVYACRRGHPVFPRSSLPLRRFSPLPPFGPCSRSPRPTRPFPRPQPPISPVGTKMSTIRQAGLLRTGWWQAGPRGKSPSRPLAVVGDSISLPRFLHRPQQYHPVHCRLAVRHSHA